jgi:hypothetical protein
MNSKEDTKTHQNEIKENIIKEINEEGSTRYEKGT